MLLAGEAGEAGEADDGCRIWLPSFIIAINTLNTIAITTITTHNHNHNHNHGRSIHRVAVHIR